MSRLVWLASYPKSGNTWFRLLIANLCPPGGVAADINNMPGKAGIASSRELFDTFTLVESGLLSDEECDALRPRVYEALAKQDSGRDDETGVPEAGGPLPGPHFVKAHDAYTVATQGEPLLAAADRAIVIVRDPRGIAPSLANHRRTTIDEAITFMASDDSAFSHVHSRQPLQLRQKLLSWSAHVESWLDQRDFSVHLVRYEDLHADTAGIFQRAMHFAGRALTGEELQRAVRLAGFASLQAQERDNGFREAHIGTVFFRRGEAESWRSELTPEQISRIEGDHAPMMTRLGYLPRDQA